MTFQYFIFQTLPFMTIGIYPDIEAGAKIRSDKTKYTINKCSRFIMKSILMVFIVTMYIVYFMAISTNTNIIGKIQDFAVANVTNSPIGGISFSCPCIH